MPPRKKPRCASQGCSDRPQLISGTCDLCERGFCGKHRLYEDHDCPQLEECKKELHERNAAKLKRQKTEVAKG